MSKHNLREYAYAKELTKDYLFLEKELDKMYKLLYPYQQYLSIQHVLDSIADVKPVMKRQYTYYKEVIKKKGKE